jgi:hypothetical protein
LNYERKVEKNHELQMAPDDNSFGVAGRYAERGDDAKSRRDDTLLTVGGA